MAIPGDREPWLVRIIRTGLAVFGVFFLFMGFNLLSFRGNHSAMFNGLFSSLFAIPMLYKGLTGRSDTLDAIRNKIAQQHEYLQRYHSGAKPPKYEAPDSDANVRALQKAIRGEHDGA